MAVSEKPAKPSAAEGGNEKRAERVQTSPPAYSEHDAKNPREVESSLDLETPDGPAGVVAIEAIQKVWPKSHLIAAYAMIWLIYFITSIEEVCVRAFNPWVTSSFSSHSLTAATGIFASIIGGLSKLPLAKILDVWGRPQGMALMLFIWTLGFIMMAATNGVELYAAAQVFSTVGAQGISYCLTIFVADTSSLRNRGLMLAYATSPYIVTTWIGGPMSDQILKRGGIGWRWGFGIFSIITPVVVAPLILLFIWNQRRAERLGLIPAKQSDFSLNTLKKLAIDFDLFGVFLLAAGMAMFLTPLAIYSYQEDQWRSPLIICLLIFGGLLVIAFIAYEKWLAPVNFVPPHLLAERNVIFAGIMLVFVFANSMLWGSYFSSMCMVAWNTTVTTATYISNIYRVGSCFAAIPIGFAIRYTRRFKWVAVFYALPLMMLGVGLMIHFRQPDVNLGYIVMTQVFVAFAGGPIVIAAELAMMSQVTHKELTAIMAILDLFGSVGSAIGSSIAAAIWTGVFPKKLEDRLPPGANIKSIYSSLYTQLAYRVGTPTRIGISWAYGDTQRYMLIASTCMVGAGWICTWFWKNTRLSDAHFAKNAKAAGAN
ncbi:putative siderophore iron transporter [Podospora australis]|uniref:Siderophore iron transporter n=1 Tax=Podospora australis TaxID=1536484 RepID=A0AAN6WPC1_9PEZI|nr:putative siderophore iron transporter [Podospora australis]